MHTNQQINFLQERIEEIGSALFHNLSDAVLKLPASIITSVKADEFGFVWFFVEKPNEELKEFEQEFPVKMDFYRKGKDCYLQITGKGYVVNDPEAINWVTDLPEEMKKFANSKYALVKVKIQQADYHETRTSNRSGWWQHAWTTITTWFGNSTYRTGNMYFPAS